jgi:hypothetical protein
MQGVGSGNGGGKIVQHQVSRDSSEESPGRFQAFDDVSQLLAE